MVRVHAAVVEEYPAFTGMPDCKACGDLAGNARPATWRSLQFVAGGTGRDMMPLPELAGWRRERMPGLPDTAWFELGPDWLCEVLSPSTAREDRVEKLPIYASFGVRRVWLIDPTLRTLEAYEDCAGKWLLLAAFENDNQVSIVPSTPSRSISRVCGRIDREGAEPLRLIHQGVSPSPHAEKAAAPSIRTPPARAARAPRPVSPPRAAACDRSTRDPARCARRNRRRR